MHVSDKHWLFIKQNARGQMDVLKQQYERSVSQHDKLDREYKLVSRESATKTQAISGIFDGW